MPWAVLVCDPGDDPEKVMAELFHRGNVRPVEGGWLIEDTAESRRTAAHRDRQRRYRQRRKGDASDARPRDARDAFGPGETMKFGGENRSLSAEGLEREIDTPKSDASDARHRDARDSDARDADDNPGNPWKVELPTADEREIARAEIARAREILNATETERGNR